MKQHRSFVVSGVVALILFAAIAFLLVVRGKGETIYGPDEYSEAELGVRSIIDKEYELSHPWMRAPTSEMALDQVDLDLAQFYELRGHARERRYFEFQISMAVSDAIEELEGELDYYSGILALAFDDTFEKCALANEIPGGGETLSSLARDYDLSEGRPALDLDEEELVDVRHRCAVEASQFPSLPAEVRDDLVERTLDSITFYVEEWMEMNPHLVVPLEYHPGANQPFADEIVEFCQQAPDPQECARSAGVDSDG